MSGISTSTKSVYRTCYHIDLAAQKETLGKYNYTEMMKKAAQQTDDNITYYEPDEYGRVFVDPAHPSRATFESADTSGISLLAPTTRLSANHRVIIGPEATIPMWTEDTVYYGMDGNNQDVHVILTEGSTEDDPIVRIKGHSASGEFDFTRHIKDIDPSNASYAEMCALIGWEEWINPSGKKGLLMPTPLGMGVGNVTLKQNFVGLSSQYHASGKFSTSIADQAKELLELYQRLMEANHQSPDDFQMYHLLPPRE